MPTDTCPNLVPEVLSWQSYKLGNVISLEYGRALQDYREQGGCYEVFGTNGKIGFTVAPLHECPSVVIGRKGAYRGVHLAEKPFYVIDTAYFTKAKDVAVDVVFLYYWFKCIDINAMDSGSAIPSTSRDEIYELDILLPGEIEQKATASVLRSIDDKSDLLQRQNQTLEAMAETLFRQWFGDDASQDWPVGSVEDLFVLQRGYDLPRQERIDGPHPIVTSSGFSGGHTEYKVKAPGVTTGRSGLLGQVYLVHEDFWPLNTSLYIKEFKRGTPMFSYLFLKTMDLPAFNAGSAVPTLNRNHVHAYTVPLPPRELVERFETLVEPLLRKVHQNGVQVASLQKLRDTLLPKLMSGEVRVAC